jgi:hypothetical protein
MHTADTPRVRKHVKRLASTLHNARSIVAHVAAALVLTGAVVNAALPSGSIPAGRERGCCAEMLHQSGNCPPQNGMNGICCNTATLLQLFFETGELRLEPGSTEDAWAAFLARESERAERPPSPPPRI